MGNKATIGSLIEAEVRKQMSIVDFARKINCTRAHVYRIFKKNDLSIDLLMQISKVLGHNFFEDLSRQPEMAKLQEINDEEICRLQALDQFLEYVPKAFERLGYVVSITKGGRGDIDPKIPLPDYVLSDFNFSFTEGMTYHEKCGNFFKGLIDFFDFPNSSANLCGEINKYDGLQYIDIAIVLKDEEEWFETIKEALYIADSFYFPHTKSLLNKPHRITNKT